LARYVRPAEGWKKNTLPIPPNRKFIGEVEPTGG
jgi:hypothetical protein